MHFYPQLKDRDRIFRIDDQRYQDTIRQLEGMVVGTEGDGHEETFRMDNTYNGVTAPYYIMYKLEPIEHSGLRYEFLVEYQIGDPNTGIYFGCKVSDQRVMDLFQDGRLDEASLLTQQMVDRADKEWEQLRFAAGLALNNTYPDKRFDLRFCHTENANDGTYWPFWIRLYEEEDVRFVAAHSVRLLKNLYLTYFSDHGVIASEREVREVQSNAGRTAKAPVRFYSEEAYRECAEFVSVKHGLDLDGIMTDLINKKAIFRHTGLYERAYCLSEETDVTAFCKDIKAIFTSGKRRGRTPWIYLDKIFISYQGTRIKLGTSGKVKAHT